MDFIDMSSTMTLPALGRRFQLGMLYDCRSDAIIPGSMLDMDIIYSDLCVPEEETTEFKIIASDSIEDKMSALELPDSLKASFLCGKIDVSGAAKYLKEKKASKKQARVTLMHTVTAKFEQLTMESLKPPNITLGEIFNQDIATHVVSGVLYGAQAFYVFEHGVSSNVSKHEIQGELQKELKIAISKIPISTLLWHGCSFTEHVAVNKPDKCNLNNASCTFYADYALKGKPSDTSGGNVVPLKVWLYPLWKLTSRTPLVVQSICSVLIKEIQAIVEELGDIDVQCDDLLDEPAPRLFPDIKSKIQRFRNLCQQYRLSFQKAISAALLSIRRGDGEEAALQAILTAREQSPFSTEKLTQYIESVEKEVAFVSFCLTWMKGSPAVITENSHVLLDPRVERVACFMFTSLQEEEPYVSDLKHWLQLKNSSATSSSDGPMEKKSINWLDNADINQNTRTYLNEFIEFANSNILNEEIRFIVSAITDSVNPGGSIYLYEKGVLKTASFRPPRPDVPVISEISHDSMWLTCAPCPAGSDQVLGYRVECRSMKDDNWTIMDGMHTNQAFSVTGLLPNSMYQFRQSAVLAQWATRPSDPTAITKTLPCSPPENVIDMYEKPTSITFSWDEPGTIGAGTQVTDYKIEFMEESEKNKAWREVMTGKKTEEITVQGLKPNSSYRFRVSAVCKNAGRSSPSEESVFSTIAKGGHQTSNYTIYDSWRCSDGVIFH